MPTGRVTCQLFGPADPECQGPPLMMSKVRVKGAGTAASDTFPAVARGCTPGAISCSGDDFYEAHDPGTLNCGDSRAPATVVKGVPTTVSSPLIGYVENSPEAGGVVAGSRRQSVCHRRL